MATQLATALLAALVMGLASANDLTDLASVNTYSNPDFQPAGTVVLSKGDQQYSLPSQPEYTIISTATPLPAAGTATQAANTAISGAPILPLMPTQIPVTQVAKPSLIQDKLSKLGLILGKDQLDLQNQAVPIYSVQLPQKQLPQIVQKEIALPPLDVPKIVEIGVASPPKVEDQITQVTVPAPPILQKQTVQVTVASPPQLEKSLVKEQIQVPPLSIPEIQFPQKDAGRKMM